MRKNRLLTALGLSATAAAAAVAVPFIANSAASDYKLPDLVSVAPPTDNVYLVEGTFPGASEELTENRLLVRFDGYIDNLGEGAVHFEGKPTSRTVKQWVQPRGGGALVVPSGSDAIASPGNTYPLNNDAEYRPECITPSSAPPAAPSTGPCVIYSTTDSPSASDGHNHWHLVGAARYSLWNESGTAQVSPGQKVGFCLYDYDRIPGHPSGVRYYGYSPGTDNFCQQYDPNPDKLVEGINPGFRDVYESRLAWQWIDISYTAPGRYRLGDEVDPYNRIWESNEHNPVSTSPGTFVVPGWVAAPPAGTATVAGQPVAVSLGATRFGDVCKFGVGDERPAEGDRDVCTGNHDGTVYMPSVADRRFVVTQAPTKGTLNVAEGQVFTADSLTYTPAPGVDNTVDTFQYAVYDAASAYPLTRTSAAVGVAIGAAVPTVAISNNPAATDINTQVALRASLFHVAGPVIWSVNGVTGGNSTVGTIDGNGVYAAPAAVPAGGSVTVRATLASDPTVFSEVTIRITQPPTAAPQPLPYVPPTKATTSRTATLRVRPLVSRMGSRLAVRVVPPVAGRLTVSVFRGRTRVKACVFPKAVKGRAVVCYVRSPRTMKNVRVVAVEKVRGSKRTIRATVVRKRL